MPFKLTGLLMLLGISMFAGIVILSIGIGAAITPMQGISAPIVCGSDQLELEKQYYSYKPGQSGYTITWYCVERATGQKRDKTFPIILTSGVLYGVGLFVISAAWLWAASSMTRPRDIP